MPYNFYMLESSAGVCAEIDYLPDPCGPDVNHSWIKGMPLKCKVNAPFRTFTKLGHQHPLTEYYPAESVMSSELVKALQEAGVDNLQAYDLTIENDETGEEYTTHKAVNVIGVLSALDYGKTKFDPNNESRFLDAGIDSLAIDPEKTKGLLMFRLKESITDIAIHESVKKHLESTGKFKGLDFIEPEEFISL